MMQRIFSFGLDLQEKNSEIWCQQNLFDPSTLKILHSNGGKQISITNKKIIENFIFMN